MFEEQLQFAAAALASGNLAASEIVCRNILDSDHRNAAALNLLGIIAGRVGAVDRSAAYFKAALRAAPNEDKIRRNLKLLKKRPPADGIKKPGRQYLLIKSWGYGFWSDVSQVLGTLLLAEITNRIPVTHWGTNSLFGDGSNGDAFKLYFEPVSNFSLFDLARVEDATFFPQKWNRTSLT